MQHTKDSIGAKAVAFDYAMSDLDGLQWSLEANVNDFSTFTKSYTSRTAFDDNTVIQAKTVGGPWTIDASSVRAAGPITSHTDISAFASQQVRGLAKGTIATVQVGAGDKWSPTCALQQQNVVSGGITSPQAPGNHPIDLSNSLTGPEGYVVTLSNGNDVLHQNTTGTNHSDTTQIADELKVCADSRPRRVGGGR